MNTDLAIAYFHKKNKNGEYIWHHRDFIIQPGSEKVLQADLDEFIVLRASEGIIVQSSAGKFGNTINDDENEHLHTGDISIRNEDNKPANIEMLHITEFK